MKLNGEKVDNIKEIQTTAYECPYCGTKMFNKLSYRGHLLKSQYCEIIRYNGYELNKGYMEVDQYE
jgi:DNA-directed RNA polymerase subunit RPC12/RpoP